MTCTRTEFLAVFIAALVMCAACLGLGALAGAGWAWSESASRLSEAREAQAEAALLTLECKTLADRCVCAVGGVRCPKGN